MAHGVCRPAWVTASSAVAIAGQYPLLSLMPRWLRHRVEGSVWDVERLWSVDASVELVPVDSLRWHFRLPLWRYDDVMFAISPDHVRAAPRLYGEQFERTLRSDVACALTAMPGPRGLIVLDGIHRLLKADLLGHDAVPVKRLTPVDVARVVLDSV